MRETSLYQEQPQIGGGTDTVPRTTEERVAEVRRRIMETVAAGKVRLMRGAYCTPGESGTCTACALGTLAISFGKQPDWTEWREDARTLASSLVSREEADQLEFGFEGMGRGHRAFAWSSSQPDPASPFFKLGDELAQMRLRGKMG